MNARRSMGRTLGKSLLTGIVTFVLVLVAWQGLLLLLNIPHNPKPPTARLMPSSTNPCKADSALE